MKKAVLMLASISALTLPGMALAEPVDYIASGVITDDLFPGESHGELAEYIGQNFTYEFSLELDISNASDLEVDIEESKVQYLFETSPYYSRLTFGSSAGTGTVITDAVGVFTAFENNVDLTGIVLDGTTLEGDYDIIEFGSFDGWPIEHEVDLTLIGPSDWFTLDQQGQLSAGTQIDLSAAMHIVAQADIKEIDNFGELVEELAFVRLLPDSFMPVPDEPELNLQLFKLQDLNADGVEEVAQFGQRVNNDKPQLMVTDPVGGTTVAAYTWTDSWDQPQIKILADMTADGTAEIALFGFAKADGRPQLTVKDGADATLTVATFSWPDSWTGVEFFELDDSNADGVNEMAIFGFNSNQQPRLIVRDGANPEVQLPTYSWPALWNNVQFRTLGDINNDGVDEVAIFGARKSNGKNQLIIKDGADASVQFPPYNWGDNWDDAELLVLDDMTNDGVNEIALFGARKVDGRAQAVVKDGTSRSTGVRNYGWPAYLSNPTAMLIADTNADGIDELGVVGTRTDDGRTQLVVKSGSNQSTLGAVGWNTTWVDGRVKALSDLSGDGAVDFALLGNHVAAGYAQLAVNDSATGGILRTFSWPTMDATESTLVELADMNDDGTAEVGLYSIVGGVGVLQIKNGANQAQILSTVSWPAAWY